MLGAGANNLLIFYDLQGAFLGTFCPYHLPINNYLDSLFLSGYKIIGSLKCSQGGHNLTNRLLRKIFSDKINYSLLEIKGKPLPHNFTNYHKLKTIA